MPTSARILDHKPWLVQTKTESIKARPKQPGSSHSQVEKYDNLIYKLTRFVLPPVRVNHMEVGNLYVRKEGGRKEFIRKAKGVKGCSKLDHNTQLVTCKEAMLRKKLEFLLEERERAQKRETRNSNGRSQLACREIELLQEKDKLVKERAQIEERKRQERIGYRDPQPYGCQQEMIDRPTRAAHPSVYEGRNCLDHHCRRLKPAPHHFGYSSSSSDSEDSDDLSEIHVVQRRRSLVREVPLSRCCGHCISKSESCIKCYQRQHQCRTLHRRDRSHRQHRCCDGTSILTTFPGCGICHGRSRTSSYVRVETRHPIDYSWTSQDEDAF